MLISFRVHGFSLGAWNDIVKDTTAEYRYRTVGIDRRIRSDEYAASLPLVMAQCNHGDFFPQFNDQCNGTGMDMLLSTPPCPVWDWTVIGQVQNWGCFAFGAERGVSWNWFLRYLIGFLFAFEFFLIWLRGDRLLALSAAVAITLGSPTQWWTTTVLYLNLFFFASLVFTNKLFAWSHIGWKACAAVGLLVSLSSFLFSNYPPFQLVYRIILILLGIEMLGISKSQSKSKGVSKCLLGLVMLLVVLICVCFSLVHAETIQKICNSAYPEKRVVTGGSLREFLDFQTWKLLDLFTPIRNVSFLNVCAVSVFFVPMIAFWAVVWKSRRELSSVSPVFLPLLVFWGMTLAWLSLGWPSSSARGTLSFIIPPRRMAVASSFLFLLLIFKLFGFSKPREAVVKWLEMGGVCLIILLALVVFFVINRRLLDYFVGTNWMRGVGMRLIGVSLLLVISIGLLRADRRLFLGGYLAVSLLSGAYVNPFSIGVGPLRDKQLSEMVRSIEAQHGVGLWGCNTFRVAQFLTANGFHCLNGTQLVGNPQLWQKIDSDYEYESIWNRYAYVSLGMRVDSTPKFKLRVMDVFGVYCNRSDFDALGIDYVIWSGEKLRQPWAEYLGRVRLNFIYRIIREDPAKRGIDPE